MTVVPAPHSSIIERVLLLQKQLATAPDERHMAQTLVCGLSELPGVSGAVVRATGFAPVYTLPKNGPPSCASPEGAPFPLGDCPRTCAIHTHGNSTRFAFQTNQSEYGGICLGIEDPGAFAPYEPLVANMAHVAALCIENKQHAGVLSELNGTLAVQARERAAALRESRAKYRELFESLPVGVYLSTLDGRILAANQACLDICGCPDSERDQWFSQNTLDSYVNPQDGRRLRDLLLRDGKVERFEAPFKRWDGGVVWLSNSARLVRDQGGQLTAISGSFIDVTERKRAEEALQEKEKILRAFIDQSSEGISMMDAAGTIVEWNRQQAALTGISREEALGRTVWELMPRVAGKDPASQNRVAAAIDHVHNSVKAGNLEALAGRNLVDYYLPDGTCRTVERSHFPIELSDRMLMAMISRDITERKKAEDRLRLQALVLDQINDQVTVTDLSGAIMYVNEAQERVLGYSAMDLVGRPTTVYGQDPKHGVTQEQILQRTLKDGHWRGEIVNTASDGSTVVMECRTQVVSNDAGEPACLVGIATDITENKRAEEALRESEENFRTFFESMSDIIIVASHEGNLLFTNKAACSKLGYLAAELASMNILDLHPSNTRHEAAAIFSAMLRGERDSCPLPLAAKDGSPIPAETRIWLGKWNHENCIFAICKDLTAEQEAQQRFERLFRHNPSPMALSTVPGRRFFDVNDAFVAVTGYSLDDIRGKTTAEVGLAANPEEMGHAAEQLHLEGRIVNCEFQIRRRDGAILDGMFSGEVIRNQGREYFLTVMVDITARKRAEEARQKLEVQLRQSQKMEAVGQLAGGIAHDFNNLLQVILGYGDMALTATGPDSPAHDFVTLMLKAGSRAQTLVSQLLAFSRRQVLEMKSVNLNDVIMDMMKMLRRVIGEHIALEFMPACDLGWVRADAGQMGQILTNLCVNARDAMPEGGTITIKTENVTLDDAFCQAHSWAQPGAYALIGVIDTGCGMAPEVLEKAFEPFFTTKEVGKGTGLGLATVYGLVKQHGGLVHVCSDAGNGTAFRIYLPLADATEASLEEIIEAPVRGGSETILLAEDDAMVRRLSQAVLEDAGYTVLAACNGQEALETFESNTGKIDLVLLDVIMPKLSGRAVYDQIRKTRPQLRTLFISGYNMETVHTNFALAEGLTLIQKPCRREDLLRKVREVLDAPDKNIPPASAT